MTRDDFNVLMAEVSGYFGDKTYPPKQAGLIWRILEPLSLQQGRKVVDAIVMKHARAPMPAAFKAEAIPLLAGACQSRRQDQVNHAASTCAICGGSGMMLALLKSNPIYEFSFACDYCNAAEIRGYRELPRWTTAAEKAYVKVSLKPDSYKGALEFRTRAFQRYHRREETKREEVQQVPGGATDQGVLPAGEKSWSVSQPLQRLLDHHAPGLLPSQPAASPGERPDVREAQSTPD